MIGHDGKFLIIIEDRRSRLIAVICQAEALDNFFLNACFAEQAANLGPNEDMCVDQAAAVCIGG